MDILSQEFVGYTKHVSKLHTWLVYVVGSLTRAVGWFVQIIRHPAAKDGVEAIPSVLAIGVI